MSKTVIVKIVREHIPGGELSASNTKADNIEMNRIGARAKTTFNVSTEICILKGKAFKDITGSSQRGGTYNYIQDRVLINRSVAGSYALPHLEWMIFHEYGHAYFARIFAKNSFFPTIIWAPWIKDSIITDGIRHMWNGLCDCFVNELVFRKLGLKKIDPNLEETLDKMSKELASEMCFHLYDYWKHGRNEKVAQKAKEKIPTEILRVLQKELSLNQLDSLIGQMVGVLTFIGNQLFQIKVSRKTMPKRDIEKSAGAILPEFWGDENTNLELLEIT
jgi:hypothetical protein